MGWAMLAFGQVTDPAREVLRSAEATVAAVERERAAIVTMLAEPREVARAVREAHDVRLRRYLDRRGADRFLRIAVRYRSRLDLLSTCDKSADPRCVSLLVRSRRSQDRMLAAAERSPAPREARAFADLAVWRPRLLAVDAALSTARQSEAAALDRVATHAALCVVVDGMPVEVWVPRTERLSDAPLRVAGPDDAGVVLTEASGVHVDGPILTIVAEDPAGGAVLAGLAGWALGWSGGLVVGSVADGASRTLLAHGGSASTAVEQVLESDGPWEHVVLVAPTMDPATFPATELLERAGRVTVYANPRDPAVQAGDLGAGGRPARALARLPRLDVVYVRGTARQLAASELPPRPSPLWTDLRRTLDGELPWERSLVRHGVFWEVPLAEADDDPAPTGP
ncbi:MAG: hypothetical protein ACI8PZ_001011 [Myxococcota bacterium]|jgi:hypothetical protein